MAADLKFQYGGWHDEQCEFSTKIEEVYDDDNRCKIKRMSMSRIFFFACGTRMAGLGLIP